MKKNDLSLEEGNIIYQITTSENQKNKNYINISSIHLGDCENKLKEKYKISQDLSLIILKLNIFIPEYSIPLVQYEVFNPITLESLNLKYCNQTFINILFPALINEKELYNMNQIIHFIMINDIHIVLIMELI